MLDLTQTKTLLKKWLGSHPEVEALAIFGSYARGTAKKGSDLDLFVISSPSNPEEEEGGQRAEAIERAAAWSTEIDVLLGFEKVSLKNHSFEGEDETTIGYVRDCHIAICDRAGRLAKLLNRTQPTK
jgi:predicted nucleotidyltransferase